MPDRKPSSDGQSRLPPAASGHAYPPVENSARPRHRRRAFAAGCRTLGMGASGREPTQQTKPIQIPEAEETHGRLGAFAIVEIVTTPHRLRAEWNDNRQRRVVGRNRFIAPFSKASVRRWGRPARGRNGAIKRLRPTRCGISRRAIEEYALKLVA